jgi:hypothetical protein
MDFNIVTINGTIYKVNHMKGVGFYVDIDGQATTKPTKAELLEELKTDAGNGSKAVCRVFKVHPSPSPDPSRSANP